MNSFLLDTITFDFLINEPERLPALARDIVANPANTLFLSIVSVWEISIQAAQKKIIFTKPFHETIREELAKHSVVLIDLSIEDTHEQASFPFLTIHGKPHKDPFDRLLVAQARQRQLTLVSSDTKLPFYPVSVVWA